MAVDQELQELVDMVNEASDEVSDNMSEMAFATAVALLLLYKRIQQILHKLSKDVAVWSDKYFAEIADRTALSVSSAAEAESIVANERAKFLTSMAVAVSSVLALAARMSRGQLPATNLGSKVRVLRAQQVREDSAAKIAQARLEIRRLLSGGLVQIVGMGQRTQTFAFDYYAALQAHQARQTIISQSVVRDVVANGDDLVQVSPQPSTIGDFCDQYKGKVFSVSGAHPFFHPLSLIPNGGCPMHPWCRHYLLPFDDTISRSPQELKELQEIPEDFLQLGREGANANEFQKLWLGK
jgi:hypothetical protein